MSPAAVLAHEVRKTYHPRGSPPVEALAGVSMEVQAGELVGLLGRNGAGKTTFLKIASTLLSPTSGRVEVFGFDVDRQADRVRPLIAVVPQEGKPFFHLTPREMVYTYLLARGYDRRNARLRTDEALGKMGLTDVEDRLALTLSGGQKQRTMVATVIATEAPLLFLDEPTIGMDPFARRSVWESLRSLVRKGSTLLLTTHYLDEAEALTEHLYVIEQGKVLVSGTSEEIKRRVGGTVRVSLAGGEQDRPAFEAFGSVVADGPLIHLIVPPERLGEVLALAVERKVTATVGPVTLEEAFLKVVGRSIHDDS